MITYIIHIFIIICICTHRCAKYNNTNIIVTHMASACNFALIIIGCHQMTMNLNIAHILLFKMKDDDDE